MGCMSSYRLVTRAVSSVVLYLPIGYIIIYLDAVVWNIINFFAYRHHTRKLHLR